MRVSLEDYLYDSDILTPEGIALESLSTDPDKKYVYVLLTDTKSMFSKVARHITGDPYNHVSVALDDTLTTGFTFNISNGLSRTGGFLREDLKKEMRGSRYSMYRVAVTPEMYLKLENRLNDYFTKVSETSYNFFGLVNAIARKGIFKDEEGQMICSQFVASLLHEIGITIFKNRPLSAVRPYDFVKTKMLEFVKRGTI
jgi:DNA polymerase III alpha subunit (gram-positive type)